VDRRAFLATLAGGLLAAPRAAEAQSVGKVWRIGYLGYPTRSAESKHLEVFQQRLRELGYVEGQNLVIEYRWAEGKPDRLAELAADLVRLRVAGTLPIAFDPHHSPARGFLGPRWVTFGRSRVRESRTLGSVGAKAEWLSYPTTTAGNRRENLMGTWESDWVFPSAGPRWLRVVT
jgi:hypothetical protein